MHLPERENYLYQGRYCEENIWQLCKLAEFEHSEVVFIAAHADCFPIRCQRAAEAPNEPLFWDYHVVLLWHALEQDYVLDFDTTLPFCTPLQDYLKASFYPEHLVMAEYRPQFRLVSREIYLKQFLSDRRHMKTKHGWHAPPPAWPLISADQSNLHQFTDMRLRQYGVVKTLSELLAST